VYTSGIAILTICCLIYLIEFKKTSSVWITFFDVFGKNALFIFFLSGLIPRLLGLIRIPQIDSNGQLIYINPLKWIYENWFEHLATDLRIGSMLFAVFLILCFWLIGFFLYKRKIYIKV
jgi:predicted acyltransferase